jgi:hypothetical protein
MKWTHRTLFVACAGLLPAVHGCGGGGFNSRVDGSKQLEDISADEAKQLCEDANDYADSTIGSAELEKYGCSVAAIYTGAGSVDDPKGDCQTAYDACIANPPGNTTSCDMATSPPCTATVDDYEKCIEETAAAIEDFVSSFSCDKVDELKDKTNPLQGAVCKKVSDTCGQAG